MHILYYCFIQKPIRIHLSFWINYLKTLSLESFVCYWITKKNHLFGNQASLILLYFMTCSFLSIIVWYIESCDIQFRLHSQTVKYDSLCVCVCLFVFHLIILWPALTQHICCWLGSVVMSCWHTSPGVCVCVCVGVSLWTEHIARLHVSAGREREWMYIYIYMCVCVFEDFQHEWCRTNTEMIEDKQIWLTEL